MATLVWTKGERSLLDGWLGGQSNYLSPAIIPTAGANWGVGLGTRSGGVGTSQADTMTQIVEVGTSVAAGYARPTITRDQSVGGWPAATLVGGHYQTTTAQKSFSFTNAPTPNGATLWFVAGSATTGQDNALFGADTAATRSFGNGDVERVTTTLSL